MFIRNAWYIAAWANEVSDTPLARRILNEPVVLFRDKEGKAGALADRCCHRAAPLSLGQVTDAGLQCGYHGLTFDCSGRCVAIPGQEKIPQKARVRSYPLVEKDEFLWIWMGEAEKADVSKILDYPYHNDYKKWPHKHGLYQVKCNYMLLVDNLMDLTHIGYIHGKTIGGSPMTHVQAEMETTPTDTGLKFTRWMPNSAPPPTYSKAVPFAGNVDRWQEFEYVAPTSIIQWSGAIDVGKEARTNRDQPGFSLKLFHGLTPETETTTFYFWSTANGYRQDDPEVTELLYQEIGKAFLEDKEIVEAQQKRITEMGEEALVDVVSDRARIHMRRTVERMLKEDGQAQAAA
ncbi:aromatic ring-hydroxylating dioxygenase subunit alpha [Noviherbaspirillum cavernae]|uniref:Aromatic ring-hydroxylating dioxygenase subunit alpha n=1 Tax=Noviherbaspirillum cavernae TaxID=2320862 RepID=A0A418WV59_9BURK|nr:Rieske 2Fe-2S domain-containing protein [Noviherbaspirillum cavernae]RJF96570.1 aromatic ring-hydroxylating dioxygenase subunit alpha [Noviherbaspirillum cavernae]